MAEFKFTPSDRTFTSPVRKFKENDPYYFEVDNIPLGQLEENDLFLLDQLTGLKLTGVSRSDLTELKPWATGGDSSVRVNPGRYIARINDAYGKTYKKLADPHFIPEVGSLFNGVFFGGAGKYITLAAAQEIIAENVEKFKVGVGTNALHLTGLVERILSHKQGASLFGNIPAGNLDPSSLITWSDDDYPGINNYKEIWVDIQNEFSTNILGNLSQLATEFTRRWGGAIRTALVDVASELSVQIPPFDANDFYYKNSAGELTKVTNADSATRIDLVFLYSAPVDATSEGTTVLSQKNAPNNAKNISKPELGVLVGAGLGLDLENFSGNIGEAQEVSQAVAPVISTGKSTTLTNVDAYMLPNVADSFAVAGGFITDSGTRIYGSIPSPDDVMNLAPLLFENLEDNDYRLIGQSILPLAYIVRKQGSITVEADDVVDIRPFLRTTELTYDERAGIAAAGPPLSMANPAVGRKELAHHLKNFKANVSDMIKEPPGNAITGIDVGVGTGEPNFPRPIGGGIIWGGKEWGPEGAITEWYGGDGWFFPEGYGVAYENIPEMPDWDEAAWIGAGGGKNYPEAGLHRNDRINFKVTNNDFHSSIYGSGKVASLDFSDPDNRGYNWGGTNSAANVKDKFHFIGTVQAAGTGNSDIQRKSAFQMFWVTKRINFGSLPLGFGSYDVKVSFLNCLPLTFPGRGFSSFHGAGKKGYSHLYVTNSQAGTATGIWINKKATFFEINVAFPGPQLQKDDYQNKYNHSMNSAGVADGTGFAGLGQEEWQGANSTQMTVEQARYNSRNSVMVRSFVIPMDAGHGTVQVGDNIQDRDTGPQFKPAKNVMTNVVGTCSYPTVQFEIIGYPSNYGGTAFSGLGGDTGANIVLS
jgi:hypothetical protein